MNLKLMQIQQARMSQLVDNVHTELTGKKYLDSKHEQQAYQLCTQLRQNHALQLALEQF
jgi:hypothetical protein